MTIRRTFRCVVIVAIPILVPIFANAHDLPRQRVDRTVQLRFEPARLLVEYTLELDDTTIARDLKRLRNDEELPPDPDEWLDHYGRLVAPLIASALLLDGPDSKGNRTWDVVEIQRHREIHTIYSFRFGTSLERPGKFRFRDTNFGTSEGISRLGVASSGSAEAKSDEAYPASAVDEPYRPVWMLDEKELRRTVEWSGNVDWNLTKAVESKRAELPPGAGSASESKPVRFWPLGLGFMSAALLGVLHTLQPGHGKTLLAAATLSGDRRKSSGWSIAVGWVVSHFAVIFVLAALALVLPESTLSTVSISLKKIAGFLIACPAAYRLGKRMHEVSKGSHFQRSKQDSAAMPPRDVSNSHGGNGLLLGLTAGLIPCWEAIGLLLLGVSAGHALTGLGLVLAFMSGSLCVVVISMLAARWISAILDTNRKSGQFLMIGLDVVVLVTGAGLLLASTWFQPFRS